LITNIDKDVYSARKVLRELIILRKLSEMDQNLYTTKILDVIMPENAVEVTSEEKMMSNLIKVEYEENKHSNQLNDKENVDPNKPSNKNETSMSKDDKIIIDFQKMNHLFIVMDIGQTDFKKLMESKPPISIE
jgi:hypothetical protein